MHLEREGGNFSHRSFEVCRIPFPRPMGPEASSSSSSSYPTCAVVWSLLPFLPHCCCCARKGKRGTEGFSCKRNGPRKCRSEKKGEGEKGKGEKRTSSFFPFKLLFSHQGYYTSTHFYYSATTVHQYYSPKRWLATAFYFSYFLLHRIRSSERNHSFLPFCSPCSRYHSLQKIAHVLFSPFSIF